MEVCKKTHPVREYVGYSLGISTRSGNFKGCKCNSAQFLSLIRTTDKRGAVLSCLLRAVSNVQNCHQRYFRKFSDRTEKHLMSSSHLEFSVL